MCLYKYENVDEKIDGKKQQQKKIRKCEKISKNFLNFSCRGVTSTL